MFWKTDSLCSFGFMNSVDAPVCGAKRFRKQCPAAPETPPVTELHPGSPAGSFELVTGEAGSPEVASWPELDALSSIEPMDLFAAESDPDVAFQPRWTAFGDYDFNYQPGGSSDPLATAGRRSIWFGSSSSAPWQPPQKQPRTFFAPDFHHAAMLWKPPPAVRKPRVSLESIVQQAVQSKTLSSPVIFPQSV
jgi:hypothetical protein